MQQNNDLIIKEQENEAYLQGNQFINDSNDVDLIEADNLLRYQTAFNYRNG